MLVDHNIGGYETWGLKGNSKRLIAIILLDYEYQFMGKLVCNE